LSADRIQIISKKPAPAARRKTAKTVPTDAVLGLEALLDAGRIAELMVP
jgi:hypothetical protein